MLRRASWYRTTYSRREKSERRALRWALSRYRFEMSSTGIRVPLRSSRMQRADRRTLEEHTRPRRGDEEDVKA